MSGKYSKPRVGVKLMALVVLPVVLLLCVGGLVLFFIGGSAQPSETGRVSATTPTDALNATAPEAVLLSAPDEPGSTENTLPGEALEGSDATEAVHVHNHVKHVVPPTCTEAGYTSFVCDCGNEYTSDPVPATGHMYGEWVITKDATTESEGSAKRTCSACSKIETKRLPKLDKGAPSHKHKYTSNITKEPTCSSTGIKTYTCSCGDSYTDTLPKRNHSYTTEVVKPTCTSDGYTAYTCKNCGYSYKGNVTSKVAHDFETKITKATCTTGGYTTFTCKTCHKSSTGNNTSPLGHAWGDWATTKEPTTSAPGTAKRTCTRCDKSETKTLPALPDNKPAEPSHSHKYAETVTKQPTCTSDGVKTFTCSCGDTYTSAIPATGHAWSGWVTTKEPTASENGQKTRTCSNCGNTETQTIDKLTPEQHNCSDHYVRDESRCKAATCTEDGYEVYKCSICGDTISQTIPGGHQWKHYHKDAVKEVGTAYLTCHCGWKTVDDGSGAAAAAFIEHCESLGDEGLTHSYYSTYDWIITEPAEDYDYCTICNARK